MIRTGYSFRRAFGHLGDVHKRLIEIGYTAAPIADLCNTFAWVKWAKLCDKANIKPIFGVEIPITADISDKKPIFDYWTFLAIDSVRPINELIQKATMASTKEPSLTYNEATERDDVIKITGHAARFEFFNPSERLYVGLSPAASKGFLRAARSSGHSFIARSENFYPTKSEQELYRVALGFRAGTQTYPRHILGEREYIDSIAHITTASDRDEALRNQAAIFKDCSAKLKKAELLKPFRNATLHEMCVIGATKLGCDLNNVVYGERLDKELHLIAEKQFEDYFYILADMINWAKERMIVGPARGSSCGSLVCYLLGITAIDPIHYGLIFERFIDINRKDLPDIDVDFSDVRRDMVFKYAEEKYGSDHVARLGTVGLFRPASALNQVGASLQIPKWMIERTLESVTERSSGDSRAMLALEDAMNASEAGRLLVKEYPEAKLAARMEGHPNNSSQHAAGIVITEQPLIEYIGVDSRVNAAQCDKKDAEELNLLKIDALGLTQLSIFERTLQLIGKPDITGYLETLPLDDPKAFEVLNNGKFSGIFQFTGQALKSLVKQIKVEKLDDMVAITALARPGPLATGGAASWVRRRVGTEEIKTKHPAITELTKNTLGIFIYQEQIMEIVRQIGSFSWEETSAVRKAMSGRLGDEYFEKFKLKFIEGAMQNGIEEKIAADIWSDINKYGSWCLSGDTKLINPHSNQFDARKSIKLKYLYKKRNKKQSLLCLQEKTIKPAKIVDVTYGGKRETWEIEVDTGEKLRATMEHRFLCSDGQYRMLRQLKSGSSVMLLGKTESTERKRKKGTGSGGHNWWHKLKSGSPLLKRQIAKLHKIYKRCQKCKMAPYQETHHIDGNHSNNEWDNLLPVCHSCHRRLHGPAIPYSKGKMPRTAIVVSISKPKIEDVYDVAMPSPHNNFVAHDFIVHNSFNKSHAVAYGIVSYWTCWLKAYHPYEFAAATLDAENNPLNQIAMLRELAAEDVNYVPVDPSHSIDRWSFKEEEGRRVLVGPLTNIKGIGPKTCAEILSCREEGLIVRAALQKRLDNAITPIDSLYPISDTVHRMYPDIKESLNIHTKPTQVKNIVEGKSGSVMIIGVIKKIAPRDENDAQKVTDRVQRARERGMKTTGLLSGPTQALNLFVADDTDEIFCKVDRYNFEKWGKAIIERGKPGKAIYAIKGTIPEDFRMIKISAVRYIGDIGGTATSEEKK